MFDWPLSNSSHIIKFYQLLEKINLDNTISDQKENFCLFVFDLWSLIEIGDEYEAHIRTEPVKGKAGRIAFVKYFYNEYKKNKEYFQFLSTKSFLVITFVVKKIIEIFSDKLKKFMNISEYSEQISINECYQSYEINDCNEQNQLNSAILQAKEQADAAEKLFGNDIWESLDLDYLVNLFYCIEQNQFAEVFHWLESFQTKKVPLCNEIENSTFVFCVQQDESMERYINFQTAIVLKVSEILKKCQNDIIYIPFAQHINQETIMLGSNLTVENYLDFFSNYKKQEGPINYKMVLNFAFTMLKLELSTNVSANIVLICNEKLFENFPNEEDWKVAVEQFKLEMKIEIIVLYLGELLNVKQIWFADDVVVLAD
ncbi:MAG: hypothetical protein ABS944_02980 [Solibacillus sp.]